MNKSNHFLFPSSALIKRPRTTTKKKQQLTCDRPQIQFGWYYHSITIFRLLQIQMHTYEFFSKPHHNHLRQMGCQRKTLMLTPRNVRVRCGRVCALHKLCITCFPDFVEGSQFSQTECQCEYLSHSLQKYYRTKKEEKKITNDNSFRCNPLFWLMKWMCTRVCVCVRVRWYVCLSVYLLICSLHSHWYCFCQLFGCKKIPTKIAEI